MPYQDAEKLVFRQAAQEGPVTGNKKESEFLSVQQGKSVVLNYDSGESSPALNLDGFYSGRMKPGEMKTLRATFKAPKGAKKVGITLSGLGTFEDVVITQ